MSPTEFAFWLNGYFEIENPKQLTRKQTQIIWRPCLQKPNDIVRFFY